MKIFIQISTIIHKRHHTLHHSTKNITITKEDLLVTIDISSLYTNIIHEEGLQAMKDWMVLNNISHQRAEFIKLLGKLLLKHNYFEFNGEIFLQKQ